MTNSIKLLLISSVMALTGCTTSVNSSTSDVPDAIPGIHIKNNVDYNVFPNTNPGRIKTRYWWTPSYVYQDFNNDGILDVLYNGSMNPTNLNKTGDGVGGLCSGDRCEGEGFGPSVLFGSRDGKFKDRSMLFVDNRSKPGQQIVSKELVADFNNDGILDYWVADTGMGTYHGHRDSYFLSNSDGKWYESSATHLSKPNYAVYNHGGSFGDIDNDGDLDVVMTQQDKNGGARLSCWMNNGKGFMTVKGCGNVHAYVIELGDMDGDGDLDIVHSGHEFGYSTPTGIMYNNGYGKFGRTNRLPQDGTKKWGTVPEVSMWDLDSDGDLDIVLSRAGHLYVGVAVDILENKGNGKFKSNLIKIINAPKTFKPVHEGNEWNYHFNRIRFNDVDGDGDKDITFTSNGSQTGRFRHKVNGAMIQNNGNMNFKYLPQSDQQNPITYMPSSKFVFYGKDKNAKVYSGREVKVLTLEELRKKLKKK